MATTHSRTFFYIAASPWFLECHYGDTLPVTHFVLLVTLQCVIRKEVGYNVLVIYCSCGAAAE